MRIVMVNWARIEEGASNGGGANVYAQQLSLALVGRGHEVLWLSGGLTYLPEPATGALGPCSVRRMADFRGVRTFEVFNSPVLAPGPCQAKEPLGEVAAPALSAEVGRFFRLVKPDIVHFHNIEGFSCDCVDAARGEGRLEKYAWPGAKVIFSLHNYHTICPQVYLMRMGRIACHDFHGGRDCVACMASMREPHAEKAHRAAFHMPRIEPPEPRPDARERLRQVFSPPPPKPLPVIQWPGRAVQAEADVAPQDTAGTRVEGLQVEPQGSENDGRTTEAERVPLDNDPHPDSSMTGPLNDFGTRRAEMVRMLNRCDRVLGVSSFVTAKFAAMGVEASRLQTLLIGSRLTELARDAAEAPPPGGRGPGGGFAPRIGAANASERDSTLTLPPLVRAVFLGYNNYYKGLPMLAETLEAMDDAVLARLHLSVYAKGVEDMEPVLNRLENRLGGLSLRSGYDYASIPHLLANKDVGLVPSVWWDNGPQTVMEFFACGLPVIAANLGGIPDLVRHGHNGLLFRGNDRAALAATLRDVISRPALLAELRASVEPCKTMFEHACEMEQLYLRTLA